MLNLPSLIRKIQLSQKTFTPKTQFIINHLANQFISPCSISKVMLMCLAGAKTSSTTSDYLKQILNLTHYKDEQILDLVAESIARLADALSSNESFLLENRKRKIRENKRSHG